MDGRHILVADDERNALLTMQFILEVADYRVSIAENGREALDKILKAKDNNNPVELLITDIQMPYLTGLELIDELNRLGINIPVLAITGYGDKELVSELIRKGCNKCLDKPIDDEELVECVAMLFEQKKASRSIV
jgi:two-component system CheB/CheR fusion protein